MSQIYILSAEIGLSTFTILFMVYKLIKNIYNRHNVNGKSFIEAFMNLVDSLNHYRKQMINKLLIAKLLGM